MSFRAGTIYSSYCAEQVCKTSGMDRKPRHRHRCIPVLARVGTFFPYVPYKSATAPALLFGQDVSAQTQM